MKIEVLIAADHATVRKGVRKLLQAHNDIHVVGEAHDGEQALEMAKDLQPDVVVMDISMPGLDGLRALASLRRRLPRPRVVLLSMYVTPELVRKAFRAGAHAYVLKQQTSRELARAVYAARDGHRFFSVEHDIVPPAELDEADDLLQIGLGDENTAYDTGRI